MLDLTDIRHSFHDNHVLRGVNLALESGKIVGVVGPSGGGKSVLLKIMGQVLTPDRGQVRLGVPRLTSAEDGEGEVTALMFQEGALFDSLDVFDNIVFPLVRGRVPSMTLPKDRLREVHCKAEAILARVGLTRAAHKYPGQLSGGMRRRVSLARALVGKPKVLLLDDPTAGLDPVASGVIMQLIVDLHREYLPTTVMVSHDLRRMLPIVDHVVALFDGVVVFSGSLQELRDLAPDRVKSFVSCRFDFGSIQ